MKNLEETERSI